jgi:2-iminobutanoate/2-iminopropanoate deaminase
VYKKIIKLNIISEILDHLLYNYIKHNIKEYNTLKKIITSTNAPAAIGPYSQAIEINNTIYTSGVIPINPVDGTLVTGDIVEQTHRVLKNLKSLLEDSKTSLDKVIKTTVFIKNMDDFSKLNEVYGQYFTDNYPARSCVEVARLPKDVLVEIEAIAYL